MGEMIRYQEADDDIVRQIITKESLELGSGFDSIKKIIETNSKYCGLKKLCKFYPNEKRLEYSTERIYPREHSGHIPILFLFSNPHPDSVLRGLFLSETHSRTFWQRLSEINKNYLEFPPGVVDLERWDESIPRLREIMLKGDYKSPFLLYFHCFYPVPTNQLQDFKSLFKRGTEPREAIDMTSKTELVRLTKEKDIKHIIAFTVPLFRMITKTNKPGWRDLIKRTKHDFLKNDFPKDKDVEERQARLSLGNANDVNVYMGLDTMWKNRKTGDNQRYFTLILDAIFSRIYSASPDGS